jgi:tetratricopeptide (TPR) repeat protein
MGDLASAEVRIPKAIAACTAQGIARHTGSAYAISSDIRKVKGDLAGARADCSKAKDIFTKAGSADLIAWINGSLALIDLEDNRLPDAETALREALDEAIKERDNDGAIWTASYLSRTLQGQGKFDEARKVLEPVRRDIHPDTDRYVRALFTVQDQRLKTKPASSKPASQQSLASAHDELKRQSAELEKLDFKFAAWESDLAAGEIDLSLNPQRAREELSALSAETRHRGYELYARKADRLLAQLPPKQ